MVRVFEGPVAALFVCVWSSWADPSMSFAPSSSSSAASSSSLSFSSFASFFSSLSSAASTAPSTTPAHTSAASQSTATRVAASGLWSGGGVSAALTSAKCSQSLRLPPEAKSLAAEEVGRALAKSSVSFDLATAAESATQVENAQSGKPVALKNTKSTSFAKSPTTSRSVSVPLVRPTTSVDGPAAEGVAATSTLRTSSSHHNFRRFATMMNEAGDSSSPSPAPLKLPRTLSTSVLKVKYRSSFWEKFWEERSKRDM